MEGSTPRRISHEIRYAPRYFIPPPSTEQRGDGLAIGAAHAERTLRRGHEREIERDAEREGDGGVEVGRADLALDDVGGGLVGLSISLAALDAAAGHEAGEGFREMVPAQVAL